MNASCAICSELFTNVDGSSLNITQCGHIFHSQCLRKWLERSKTCPECRHKTFEQNLTRMYFNISSLHDTTVAREGAEGDVVMLQDRIDKLKLAIIEKDGAIKSKEQSLQEMRTENAELKNTQRRGREAIIGLEQKLEQLHILNRSHVDQNKYFQSRIKEIGVLQEQLKEAHAQIQSMESIKLVLDGTQKEAEDIIQENRCVKSLAATTAALKRELRASETKRSELRRLNNSLQNEVRHLRSEKDKLEEEFAVIESKLYRFRSGASKADVSLGSTDMEMSPITIPKYPVNNTLGSADMDMSDAEIDALKSAKGEKSDSPYLKIKSSSIAGLAISKRSRSGLSAPVKGLQEKSTSSSNEFSIFKKPRLAPLRPSAKSALRPGLRMLSDDLSSATQNNENYSENGDGSSSDEARVPNGLSRAYNFTSKFSRVSKMPSSKS